MTSTEKVNTATFSGINAINATCHSFLVRAEKGLVLWIFSAVVNVNQINI